VVRRISARRNGKKVLDAVKKNRNEVSEKSHMGVGTRMEKDGGGRAADRASKRRKR